MCRGVKLDVTAQDRCTNRFSGSERAQFEWKIVNQRQWAVVTTVDSMTERGGPTYFAAGILQCHRCYISIRPKGNIYWIVVERGFVGLRRRFGGMEFT